MIESKVILHSTKKKVISREFFYQKWDAQTGRIRDQIFEIDSHLVSLILE